MRKIPTNFLTVNSQIIWTHALDDSPRTGNYAAAVCRNESTAAIPQLRGLTHTRMNKSDNQHRQPAVPKNKD